MISLTNTREIQPQIQPQTVTRFQGEQLVISFKKGWRLKHEPHKVTGFSSTDNAKEAVTAFRGFKTFSVFENWVFSLLHSQYEQVGSALIYVSYKQVGLGRRFAVNKLDIVIREFEDANKLKYLGVACVRIRDISVSVVFTALWNSISENRRIFEGSVTSLKFIPRKLI
jgi:hypothetical protein